MINIPSPSHHSKSQSPAEKKNYVSFDSTVSNPTTHILYLVLVRR